MPSPLVTQVRQLLAAREDEGRPISPPERALLLETRQRVTRVAWRAVATIRDRVTTHPGL